MAVKTFVVPKTGADSIGLCSEPRIAPENVVGQLPSGTRLELVEQGEYWQACKVYLSAAFANADNGLYVVVNEGDNLADIRSAPSSHRLAAVGDLRHGRRLEFIERVGDWLTARVYVRTHWAELINEGEPEPEAPEADGVDAPVGTPPERAADKLWPGLWYDATGFAVRYRGSPAPGAYHTGADLNLPDNRDAFAPCYAPATGIVRVAKAFPVWGNIIVIEHRVPDGTRFWSRLAHLDNMLVLPEQIVKRGDLVGHIGNAFGRYAYHLHFDLAKIDLGKSPDDWPGNDLARVQRSYFSPFDFIKAHRSPKPWAPTIVKLGLHDLEGGLWMKQTGLKGVCLALATVRDQPIQLDFTGLAQAGVDVLLRIGYGYADGTGTLAPPEHLKDFEKAVAVTLNEAKGVGVAHYGNEINNPSESPGWDSSKSQPGPKYYALTPDYYVSSYNRVWSAIRSDVKLGPAPLDPYFGPAFSFLKFTSDNREWWRVILEGITGAEALFLHSKTQSNDPAEVDSAARFSHDPLRWQHLHFRAIETYLAEVPSRFKSRPVYITEANPQRITVNRLGWQPDNTAWINACVGYLRVWNADPQHQPIVGVVFYRWANDEWALADKQLILDRIAAQAQELAKATPEPSQW